jgi:HK97 family phage portal protein
MLNKLFSFGRSEAKEISHTWPAFRNFLTGGDGSNVWTYDKRIKYGYKGTDVVFSATDYVASAFASVPLRAGTVKGEGDDEEFTALSVTHPLNQLLLKPNPHQNMTEWLYAVASYRVLGGKGFTYMDTGDPADLSKPVHLWPFAPPSTTFRNENGRQFYQYNRNDANGVTFNFEVIPIDPVDGASNIVDWKTFDPEDLTDGMSPLKPADLNAQIYRYGNIWNKTYFQHGARPSTALVSEIKNSNGDPVFLDEEEFNRMKEQLNEVYSGLANGNGKPIVLEHIKPMELSSNAKDADFAGSHDMMSKDVYRTLKIPPILLNQGADTTFNNQAEAKLNFWDDAITPLVNSHSEELTEDLAPRYGDNIVIRPDYTKIPALEPRRKEAWERAQKSQELTINEKRKLMGMESVGPEGDVIMVEAGKIPLGVAVALGINGMNE